MPHIERLTKLAELLESATGRDVPFPTRRKPATLDMRVFAKRDECGTVACAAGIAGLHPWFRRQGFQTNINTGWVAFGRYSGGQAVHEFFGTWQVFSPDFYRGKPSPKVVAKAIRTLLRALTPANTEQS
jgi:hypothetical protein